MEDIANAEGANSAHSPRLPPKRTNFTTTQQMMLLGEATYLFLHSRPHQSYYVGDLATFVITPIGLGQFRMYRSSTRPVGFVAWAYLTDEASEAYASNARKLKPEDFAAGENLWFIEFIAPFGHARRIINDLRHQIFPKKHGRTARRLPGSKRTAVVDWYGVHYRPS